MMLSCVVAWQARNWGAGSEEGQVCAHVRAPPRCCLRCCCGGLTDGLAGWLAGRGCASPSACGPPVAGSRPTMMQAGRRCKCCAWAAAMAEAAATTAAGSAAAVRAGVGGRWQPHRGR
jgi:hypothetical protein